MAITVVGFEQETITGVKNSTGSVSGERYTGGSLDGINPHGIQYTITGGPIDITEPVVILIQLRTQNLSRFEFEDSSGNVRYWENIKHRANSSSTWILYGSNLTGFVEDPGFDATDVVYFNYLRTDLGSTNNTFFVRPSVYDGIKITAVNGDDAGFNSIADEDPSPFGSSAAISLISAPIIIGDDDATVFSETNFSGVIFDLATTNLSGALTLQYQLTTDFSRLETRISTAVTIPTVEFVDRGYTNNSTAVVTHLNWICVNLINNADFGASGVINGLTAFNPAVSINGGATNTGLVITGSAATYAFNWRNGATLQNSRITNSTGSAVRITEDKTLTNLTLEGNNTDFFVDVPSGTITITVDSGSTTDHPGGFNDAGYVAAKVTTAGATVLISSPVQTFLRQISGFPAGSAVGIFLRSSSLIANTSQFTLASGNNSGNGTVVINETIPNDTPASGFIRISDSAGEDRLEYASWTGSTFTLVGTLPQTYSSGTGAYVGYLDALGTAGTSESDNLEHVADRDCVLVVRLGSGTSKFTEIRLDVTLSNQDFTQVVSPVTDLINIS